MDIKSEMIKIDNLVLNFKSKLEKNLIHKCEICGEVQYRFLVTQTLGPFFKKIN